MSLTLLLPVGLSALAALLLPLLIHLARRSEHRPTEFAALRWLRTRPRPRHRVRLEQWPLLLVRLLLLALLALLLAQPALIGRTDDAPRVAVAPGLDLAQARAGNHPANTRWLWLAEGFPSLDTPMPRGVQPSASLLRDLDSSLPATAKLTVIVPAQWGELDAQRVTLSRQIDWKVLPGTSPARALAKPNTPTLRVFVDNPEATTPALRPLRALQSAWHTDNAALLLSPTSANTIDLAPNPGSVAVWLSSHPVPEHLLHWTAQGGRLLLQAQASLPKGIQLQPLWRDEDGIPLLEGAAMGNGRVLRFSRTLLPSTMPQLLDADFPDHMRNLLQPPVLPQRAFAQTQAPDHDSKQHWLVPPQPLTSWLAVVIALLFLLERAMATLPRYRRTA